MDPAEVPTIQPDNIFCIMVCRNALLCCLAYQISSYFILLSIDYELIY